MLVSGAVGAQRFLHGGLSFGSMLQVRFFFFDDLLLEDKTPSGFESIDVRLSMLQAIWSKSICFFYILVFPIVDWAICALVPG
jgi:hypothetical protein